MDKTDTDPLIKHLIESNFNLGRSQIEEGKDLIPQATVLAEDEEGVVAAPIVIGDDMFTSSEKRSRLPVLMKSVWLKIKTARPKLKLLAVAILIDTWTETMPTAEYAKRKREGQQIVPPSQKLGSAEGLLFQLILEDVTFMYTWSYVRADQTVVFAPIFEKNNMSPLFKDLWPL